MGDGGGGGVIFNWYFLVLTLESISMHTNDR